MPRPSHYLSCGLCLFLTLDATAAVNFNFNFDNVDAQAQAAAQRAANAWSARLIDPVTVNIDFAFGSLASGVLGQTGSVTLQDSYDIIRNQMVADNAAESQNNDIVNYLPTAANVTYAARTSYNGNPITNAYSGNIIATKANLKAMGFTGLDQQFGNSDGAFTFSNSFNFDYDNSNGVTAGFFDFETVVLHEIGHLLGFISIVDGIDNALAQGATNLTGISPTAMDLFRFDTNALPTTNTEFQSFARDLSTEDNAALTDTSIVYSVETGKLTGSGEQASHWKNSEGDEIGAMNPNLAPNEIFTLTEADLLALDLIGWDISHLTPVPEPSSYALLLGFLALTRLTARNRRSL